MQRASPLSETQRYFHNVIASEGHDPAWQHVANGVAIAAPLDPSILAAATAMLERRHPVLTSRLAYAPGPEWHHAEPDSSAFELIDARDGTDAEMRLRIAARIDAPFSLFCGRIWRLVLALTPAGQSVVVVVLHHLIGDGASSWILLDELAHLCAGDALPPAPPTYDDYVAEQRDFLAGDEAERRLERWHETLENAPPSIAISGAPTRDQLCTHCTHEILDESGGGQGLTYRARAARTTPMSMVASAAISGVKRATAQQDVLAAVITDVRGPTYARTVGVFSDLTLLRDLPSFDTSEAGRQREVRNAFLKAWGAQLPVMTLLERLPCFAESGQRLSPADIFLNMIPAFAPVDLSRAFGVATTPFAVPRAPSPTRRALGPLFFFAFFHSEDLRATVTTRDREALEPVVRRVIGEVGSGLREAVADGAPA